MKKQNLISVILCVIVLIGYYAFRSYAPQQKSSVPSSHTPVTIPTVITESVKGASTIRCSIRGVLPDPACTPGAIDPAVTQGDIAQTICSAGYTKKVRPPVSYTNQLKHQQIITYGYTDTNTKDYEEDHLISLELGGSPADPKNLWPEPGDSPNPKDTVENRCHEKVCDGQIALSEAQKEIATNWTTACE